MARRPAPPANPAFDPLCRLLSRPADRLTPTNYVEVARLTAAFRDRWLAARPRGRPAGEWVYDLEEQLREHGVTATDSLLHRYLRLSQMDRAFLAACRRAERVTFEHLRLLFGVADPALRRELLGVADAPREPRLSVREFKELVRLRSAGRTGRKPGPAAGRAAYRTAAAALAARARRAATAAARWLDDQQAEAAALAAAAGRDPAAAGRVRAAVRQFAVAAAGLTEALEAEAAALGGGR